MEAKTTMRGIRKIGIVALLMVALAMAATAQADVALAVTGTLTAAAAIGSCPSLPIFAQQAPNLACLVMPVNSEVRTVTWEAAPGGWSATLTFEGSVDGVNWYAVAACPPGSAAGTRLLTVTGPGIWYQNAAGLSFVRVRVSAYSSGAIVITGKRSSAWAMVD